MEQDASLWTSFAIPPPLPEQSGLPPLPPGFAPPPRAEKPPWPQSVLHHEMLALVRQLELTPQEVEERQEAVGIIRDVAQEIWPYAEVIMFGSSATGLAHCGSDLDLVIHCPENRRARMPPVREWMSAMEGTLQDWQLCSEVQKVPNAKVPIVKCVLRKPALAVDIAFFVMNGPQALPFIRQQLQIHAPLRPLCLVLKCMLGQRGLQEVYSGGIGSYCLLNMVVAYLQKADPAQKNDLGALLLGFLKRYTEEHDYRTDIVSVRPGSLRNKFDRKWSLSHNPNLLSVEDPQNPSQDIAKASFRIADVRVLFTQVRRALEAHWNQPGIIRRVLNVDRNRKHLAEGPVLQPTTGKKRKQQGGANGPAESPPNKRRRQELDPLPKRPSNPVLEKVITKMESAREAYAQFQKQRNTAAPKQSASKGAGALDAWLASGQQRTDENGRQPIGVLRDGIGGGTAVRFTPPERNGLNFTEPQIGPSHFEGRRVDCQSPSADRNNRMNFGDHFAGMQAYGSLSHPGGQVFHDTGCQTDPPGDAASGPGLGARLREGFGGDRHVLSAERERRLAARSYEEDCEWTPASEGESLITEADDIGEQVGLSLQEPMQTRGKKRELERKELKLEEARRKQLGKVKGKEKWALREKRRKLIEADPIAQNLQAVHLDPLSNQTRTGICKLAQLMSGSINDFKSCPIAVKRWVNVSNELRKSSDNEGWLPKPIHLMSKEYQKVLRRAICELGKQEEVPGKLMPPGQMTKAEKTNEVLDPASNKGGCDLRGKREDSGLDYQGALATGVPIFRGRAVLGIGEEIVLDALRY